MKKYLLLTFITLMVSQFSFGQATIFTDYFDAYNAGTGVACQNQTNWTTWSNLPCGPEDAMVSDSFYSSPSRSILIVQNNDLVKTIANFTSGDYSVVFKFYIPAGKSGYFNVLQLFSGGSSEWGFECKLNVDGSALINAGGANSAQFTYTQDAWHTVAVNINIEDTNDVASFKVDTLNVHTWVWSTGADGTGNLKQIGGVNFYGELASNKMYVDNFQIWNNLVVGVEDFDQFPNEYSLYQNYPNPFNPSTKIIYSVPEAGNIKVTLFNSLGEKVAVIADSYKERGTYEVDFNAMNLTSGTYIYSLEAGNVHISKKMLLLK